MRRLAAGIIRKSVTATSQSLTGNAKNKQQKSPLLQTVQFLSPQWMMDSTRIYTTSIFFQFATSQKKKDSSNHHHHHNSNNNDALTNIANSTDTPAGIQTFLDPTYDLVFKKVFSSPENEQCLISLLNSLLRLKGSDQIIEVQILSVDQLPVANLMKESLLDIRCRTSTKEFLIEMQRAKESFFDKRALFYASKAYSNQLKKGENYKVLKPVIILTILKDGEFFPGLPYLTFHSITEKGTQTSFLRDMAFVFLELSKFKLPEDKCSTMEEQWVHFLKTASQHDRIPESSPPQIQRAYNSLMKYNFTSDELFDFEKIEIDGSRIENLIKESKIEGKIEVAESLIADGMSAEKIAKHSGLTLEHVEKLVMKKSPTTK